MEVYYDEKPSPERRQMFAQRVRDCLAAFERSEIFADIRARDGFLWVERDDDAFEPRTIFQVEWDEAYGSPDFVREVDGRVEIFDWKTGTESPEDEVQVTVYAAWALEQLQADPKSIEGRLVYLNDGARVELPHHVRLLLRYAERHRKRQDADPRRTGRDEAGPRGRAVEHAQTHRRLSDDRGSRALQAVRVSGDVLS